MNAEEEIGPVCIITANGIICMESPPKLLVKAPPPGKKKGTTRGLKKPLVKAKHVALVKAVQKALMPADKADALASPTQRRHIACLAVFLAEAAKLMAEHRKTLNFAKYWAIVKRP